MADLQLSMRTRLRRKSRISQEAWCEDQDLEKSIVDHRLKKQSWGTFWRLAYQAIGVVYGDLGTSPLYTLPTVFAKRPSRLAIYGSCSLILWILLLQVVLKYTCITLYADDFGEGSTLSIYSLLCRQMGIAPFCSKEASDSSLARCSSSPVASAQHRLFATRLTSVIKKRQWVQQMLLVLVLLGTSMLVGDGILTPAVEVISAVSGLQLKVSISQGWIVAITSVVLIALFSIQRLGTSKIGFLFSPILIIWFAANAAIGTFNIIKYEPGILKAFNPAYGIRYLVTEGRDAWVSLGGIILCATGCEAMFSDLGHFSRPAIQFSMLVVVLPSCLLSYLGEAAFLTSHPEDFVNVYFAAVPSPVYWPVFIIATLASIVASQSLITATFSIIKQSMALDCFPPLEVVHKSAVISGQVYVPAVNWWLMVGSVAVVIGFQTTAGIGNAFGVAFISVMLITTLLVTLVMLVIWQIHPIWALVFLAFFASLEITCMSALLYKVPHGGWFPIAMGALILALSYVWHWGTSCRVRAASCQDLELESLLSPSKDPGSSDVVTVSKGANLSRVPGLALFYTDSVTGLPPAFAHLITRIPALHHTVVFITVRKVSLPSVAAEERFLIRSLALPGFFRVVTRYGYQDSVDHGPGFISELTGRISAMVRYKRMATERMADSAVEIEEISASHRRGSKDFGSSAADEGVEKSAAGEVQADAPEGKVPLEALSCPRGNSCGESDEAGDAELPGPSTPLKFDPDKAAEDAEQMLAAGHDVLYMLSNTRLVAADESNSVRRFVLETLYPFLLRNSRSPTASWLIPLSDVVEVGLIQKA